MSLKIKDDLPAYFYIFDIAIEINNIFMVFFKGCLRANVLHCGWTRSFLQAFCLHFI